MYLKRIYISTTLLAFFMLTTPWSALAQDEQKSNNRNSQSLSASFGAGGASSPNNDIYIDDEVLEGSGSRGEIRDDLEKEDDESSGSGYGDDDEDSSSSSSRSNTNSNTNLGVSGSKDKSRISETSAGGSVPIGKDNSKQSGTSITHGGQSPDGDLEISHTHQHITPTDSGHDSNNAYGGSGVLIMNAKNEDRTASFFAQPGILAAVIGGAVVGLLCAILVVMFIVYRMRKKDEGSYALDEPKRSPTANTYAKNANNREFYA
ncbi:syndecan isoform X2 [Toxorhynchites rutilus septentrionalis]|uniref:syndecan isoform X2 n=1 Tax=Toxorhynchites rutilus septentrionalis TaxID=329112 RepID=UPI002479EF50|nr:syndecan isoform X2 [Toxorhynchites rutilus septentrionalis]